MAQVDAVGNILPAVSSKNVSLGSLSSPRVGS